MANAANLVDLPEPQTEAAVLLRSRVSEERWSRLVKDAHDRVAVLSEVEAEHQRTGESYRKSLLQIAPAITWSCYRHWLNRWLSGIGPAWERLLDERVPPEPVRIALEIREAAVQLRRTRPETNYAEARGLLAAQFGEAGTISVTSLGRIWRAAGLTQARTHPAPPSPPNCIKEEYYGGGGLALFNAALAEVGGPLEVAGALLEAAHRTAADEYHESRAYPEAPGGRDDHGRFTADYNHQMRQDMGPRDRDPRLDSDTAKRARRDVNTLRLLEHSEWVVAHKLLAMGMAPLLTEERGFDGLAGPQGAYLGILGGTPYMPSTLDKALAEMALLNVADDTWAAYARWSKQVLERWADGPEGAWQRVVIYVDATQDPYWTRQFALSGKVAQRNRVMPCLSRVAVSGGAGPPILVETVPGAISLKTRLGPLLERVEQVVGEEVGRLTIIDAEMCTVPTLQALMEMKPRRYFVTVLKGRVAKGADLEPVGERQPYRERDQIQEGRVLLHGEGAPGGLLLRTVQMTRPDSRNPITTIFATNAPPDFLGTSEVPDSYLSRWPNQEQFFRNSRDGGGLNHSHGYGGEYVAHVSLDTALDRGERKVTRAEAQVEAAADLTRRLEMGRQTKAVRDAVKLAKQKEREAKKQLQEARQSLHAKQSTPRQIYKRDVTRDSIATIAKLMMLTLCEFIIQEYFKTRMMYRTFIDQYIHMPVTVFRYLDKTVYRIQGNPRNPERTEALRGACAEVNRRELRQDGRLLIYEVVDPPGP